MNLYSIEIKVCATAYIKAESEEEAKQIAQSFYQTGEGGELPTGDYADVAVSDKGYDNPDLPSVSLSPAISFYGPWDDEWELDLVAEDIPVSEDEDA